MAWKTKPGIVVESVYFNGYKYNRYPEAKKANHRRYFTRSGGKLLHREKWKHYRGPIPPGWNVHHKNGNVLDNRISNLVCLSFKAHRAEHIREYVKRGRSPAQIVHLAAIRDKAAAWHRSPAGRAWHEQHNLYLRDCNAKRRRAIIRAG